MSKMSYKNNSYNCLSKLLRYPDTLTEVFKYIPSYIRPLTNYIPKLSVYLSHSNNTLNINVNIDDIVKYYNISLHHLIICSYKLNYLDNIIKDFDQFNVVECTNATALQLKISRYANNKSIRADKYNIVNNESTDLRRNHVIQDNIARDIIHTKFNGNNLYSRIPITRYKDRNDFIRYLFKNTRTKYIAHYPNKQRFSDDYISNGYHRYGEFKSIRGDTDNCNNTLFKDSIFHDRYNCHKSIFNNDMKQQIKQYIDNYDYVDPNVFENFDIFHHIRQHIPHEKLTDTCIYKYDKCNNYTMYYNENNKQIIRHANFLALDAEYEKLHNKSMMLNGLLNFVLKNVVINNLILHNCKNVVINDDVKINGKIKMINCMQVTFNIDTEYVELIGDVSCCEFKGLEQVNDKMCCGKGNSFL